MSETTILSEIKNLLDALSQLREYIEEIQLTVRDPRSVGYYEGKLDLLDETESLLKRILLRHPEELEA